MPTRRDVLRGGTLLGASLVVPTTLLELLGAPAEAKSILPSQPAPPPHQVSIGDAVLLSRSTFTDLSDRRFQAAYYKRLVTLTLMSVTDLPDAQELGLVGHEEAFILRFAGSATLPLKQGTYQLKHTLLGTFPLFIVPGASAHYAALINRAQG
jgi:hypothetical protein